MKTKIENKVASRSVYDMITDRITEQLAKGIVPWHQPWRVVLTFEPPFDNIPQVSRMVEDCSALGAATQVVEEWLEANGPETSFSVSL